MAFLPLLVATILSVTLAVALSAT
jgi:hypothetical protein